MLKEDKVDQKPRERNELSNQIVPRQGQFFKDRIIGKSRAKHGSRRKEECRVMRNHSKEGK